jgi:small-conductance mechanosensitive channel
MTPAGEIASEMIVGLISMTPVSGAVGLWLVVATLLLLAEIILVWRFRRWVLTWIAQRALDWTKQLGSRRLRVLGVRQIRQLAGMLVRLLSLALIMLGGFLWLIFVLEQFASTRAWGDQLLLATGEELGVIGGAALSALPGLGVVAVLYLITRVLHEILSHYFQSIEEGELVSEKFDPVTAEITRRLAGAGLWLAALIIAYPYIPGSGTAAFKGISLLAGLMVSLGSTNLVGQMVSGLSLIYTRAVRPGDFVETGAIEGTVERLGLFSCGIRTAQDELCVVPNSALAAGLKNFSRPTPGSAVKLVTTVTIGYDAPWQQVRDLLVAAAGDVPEVLKEPAPLVRQAALEDFYVRYELVFAPAHPAMRRLVLSAVHEAILNRFHAAGVQIMSPHYENDPAQPKIPPAGGK